MYGFYPPPSGRRAVFTCTKRPCTLHATCILCETSEVCARRVPATLGRRAMADDEPDVIINIHKGLDGYGIFFAQREEGMVVTKLDKGSEAEKAGVQPGDRLIRVQDNDGKLPIDTPGMEIPVTKEGYNESPAGRGSGTEAVAPRPASAWGRRGS